VVGDAGAVELAADTLQVDARRDTDGDDVGDSRDGLTGGKCEECV
jgi:hypothetical protein